VEDVMSDELWSVTGPVPAGVLAKADWGDEDDAVDPDDEPEGEDDDDEDWEDSDEDFEEDDDED
jgi:hypothetical protein